LLRSQQPVGQEIASQMQLLTLFGQRVPAGQATQTVSLAPQSAADGGLMQLAPAQHPVQLAGLQVVALHEPLSHVLPEAQATHAAPPEPQTASLVPVWQSPLLSQQPCGQDDASQTHCSPTQWEPTEHEVQNAPFAPQYMSSVWLRHKRSLQQPAQ
jgi:hypothetical protein